jgi:PAS domain S-box-containing protein
MKARNENLLGRLQNLPPPNASTIGLLYLALLGIGDLCAPPELSLMLFYLVGVAFIGWCAGPRLAILGTALASSLIMADKFVTVHPTYPIWILVWNESTRFLLIIATGLLAARAGAFTRRLSDLVTERTGNLRSEAEQHKATATTLADTVERFEQVVNNITEVFWLSDVPKNQIMYVSPGYERVWGRKCDELYRDAKSWAEALHPDDREQIVRRSLTDQATGNYDVEYRVIRPDGTLRWIRDRAFPVRNQNGDVYRIVGLAEDITERKRTRQVIQTQAAILENMAEGVVVTDDKGLIVQMNPAAERIWGYECSEVLGKPATVFSALPELEAMAVMREVLATLQTGGFWRGTFKNRRKDGAIISCEALINRLQIQDRVLMVAVEQDITERQRAEEALRQSEEALRAFLNAVPEPAMLLDGNGFILLANPTLARNLRVAESELLRKPVFDFLPPQAAARRKAMFDQVIATGKAVRFDDSRDDRVFVNWISPVTDAAGKVSRVAILALDVTERRRAEDALRQSEEALRVFLNAVPEPALLLDRDGTILVGNQALACLLGRTAAELIGKHFMDPIPPSSAEPRKAHFQEVLVTGQKVQFEDERNGRYFINHLSPVLDPAGKVSRVAAFALDITERMRAEAVLQESEQKYRALVETTGMGYLILDMQGRVLDANAEYVRLSGHQTLREILGRSVVEWTAPQDRQRNAAAVDQCVHVGSVRNLEVTYAGPNGLLTPIQINGTVVQTAKGETITSLCWDITERKRAEHALREAHDKLDERVRERTTELQAANAALLESEAQLRLALGASNAGTWAWDTVNNTSTWDERYNEHYGFDSDSPRSHEEWLARLHPDDRARLPARIHLLLEPAGGDLWNEEFRAWHPVKGERWMASLGSVERDRTGRAVRFAGINLDITERKLAEEAQRTQMAQIEAIYQSAPVGLCLLDKNFRYLHINERLASMNGLSVEAHLGRTVRQAVPHLADGTEALCRQAVASGQPVLNVELEGTTNAQPGVVRTWVTHWVPLKDPDGQVTGINVLVEEITERKAMHRTLQESEQKYRRLHESMTDAFASVDMSGRITEFNPAFQALLGYSPDELLQLTYFDLTPEKWHPYEARLLAEQVLPRGFSDVYDKEYRRKDGTVFPVELRTFLLRDANGQPFGMWAIIRDVTERKRAETTLREAHDSLEARVRERTADLQAANAALAESEERYRSLVNNLNVGVYRNEPAPLGGFFQVNPALARMHGYDSVEEFQKVRVADLYEDPRDRDVFLRELMRQGTLLNYELKLKKRDGTPIYASANATAHRGPNGEVDWIDGMIEDITERKRAEEALRQSEARIRAIITGAPILLFAVDRDGIIRFEDGQAIRAVGAVPGANVGRPVKEVYAHIPAILDNARRALRGEAFDSVVEAGPVVLDCSYSPTRDQDGNLTGYIGVATNITERHRLERQLLEISDREQARIGQDIHDGLCQHLVSLAFDANSLRQELSAQRRPQARTARRIAALLDRAITDSRQLSRGLFPVRLETEGLPSALEELAKTTRDRFKLHSRFASKGPLTVENSAMATHLYRIAQEAVRNAIKHSGARRISIRLIGRTKALELSVEDDGVGLSNVNWRQATGMGLHIMEYRARTIGATLDIGPGRQGGTLVSCCVPLMRR